MPRESPERFRAPGDALGCPGVLGDALGCSRIVLLEQAQPSSSREPPQVPKELFPPSLGSGNPEFAAAATTGGAPHRDRESRRDEDPTVLLEGQPHPGGPDLPSLCPSAPPKKVTRRHPQQTAAMPTWSSRLRGTNPRRWSSCRHTPSSPRRSCSPSTAASRT